MNKIRIVSDGGVLAEITDAETGATIPGVTAVTIVMRAGTVPVAHLEIWEAAVDVVAETEESHWGGDEKSGYFYTVSGPVTHFPPIE